MKIQLSMAKDYAPKWGVWQGIREIVQNWMDAFQDGDQIRHDGTRLVVHNKTGSLRQQDIAVLGSTTKVGNKQARGQFGDGLKVGCLSLAREGLDVRFWTGGQMFKASIEPSEEHGCDVLTFRSRKNVRFKDGVRFEIDGMTRSQWDELKGRFLFDQRGPLLQDRPGDIFVKDIWVAHYDGFAFGYNLPDAQLGRDRDLVRDFDIKWAAGRILASELSSGRVGAKRLMGMLSTGDAETEYVHQFLDQKARDKLEEAFVEVHGENAVPVSTSAEKDRAEHHGFKAVIVSQPLVSAVPQIERRRVSDNEVVHTYQPGDLSEAEDSVLQRAISLVGEEQLEGLTVEVVKFLGPDMLGSRVGGIVNISRPVLNDVWRTVQTLVEEIAHSAGPDGSFKHKWAIHNTYIQALKGAVS